MSTPQIYPIAAHLADFGKRPLSTVLLERDALAYGLSTHRVAALDFVARDANDRAMGFSRTGSVLNSGLAAPLTRNKHTTRMLLQEAGAPAPHGRRFSPEDRDSAVVYAAEIGYPVVFKPLQGTEGRGVVTNISSAEELEWAFNDLASSRLASSDVLVEEHIEGETYRAIVIDGEVVSVLISRRGSVTGDGRSTVRELIARRQELRLGNPHLMGRPIPVNERLEHLLHRQGTSLDTVLGEGTQVYFTYGSNTHQGAEPAQVIDQVDPSILRACELAARAIPGLGFAGIDFIIPDITQPLQNQRAAICEINSVPAADSHAYPLYGPPIPVTDYLLRASARRSGVRLAERRAESLNVSIVLQGRFSEDYASWIQSRADAMAIRLRFESADSSTLRLRVAGETDLVGVFASLAFTGPKASTVKSMVTSHMHHD